MVCQKTETATLYPTWLLSRLHQKRLAVGGCVTVPALNEQTPCLQTACHQNYCHTICSAAPNVAFMHTIVYHAQSKSSRNLQDFSVNARDVETLDV